MPVVDPVQVELEDLVLAVAVLERVGEQRLLHLAGDRLLRSQQGELHQLLGDRAAALGGAAGRDVHGDGPADRDRIDGAVVVEGPVLGRQGRGGPVATHLVELQRDVVLALRVALAENVAGAVVDDDRAPDDPGHRARVGQRLDLTEDPADADEDDPGDQQQGDRRHPAAVAAGSHPGRLGIAAQLVPRWPRIHHQYR